MTADAEQALLQAAVGGEFARGHDAVDAAVDHDGHVLGDGGGDADVLLDDEHGDLAFLGEAHEHFFELCDNEWGEALGGLVHHEQARIPQQRPGDGEHLLLAARKLGAAARAPLGELREGVVDAIDRPRRVGRVAGGKPQVLVHRKAAPDAASLRDVSDAEARDVVRVERGDVAAGERDRAALRPLQPDDRVAERRLAHAVAADDRQDAAVEGQVDALDGVRLAVIDVQPAHLEDRLGGASFSHGRHPDRFPAPRDRSRSLRACLPSGSARCA